VVLSVQAKGQLVRDGLPEAHRARGQNLLQTHGVGRGRGVGVPPAGVPAAGDQPFDINEILDGKGEPVQGARPGGLEA
jgi:hypothetical protein